MIYSYRWLKEYADFNLSSERLMRLLTSVGLTIEDSSSLGNDTVFECEIPANRGDLLSILGLARETSAILRKGFLEFPQIFTGKARPFTIKVHSRKPSLCPFYSARVIKGIKVGPSPDWLREKLIKAKIRPINNIVDITNFVLLETGQPLHAFDLKKIEGSITVRCALPGEKIRTLDGELRVLKSSMLVVADKKKSLAIAGIIGGEESQVTKTTRDILLESAYFAPFSIRKTSHALNLTTESSLRFERGVDPAGVLFALNRASWLIKKTIAEGEIGRLNRAGELPNLTPLKLKLRKERVRCLLGIEIPSEEIKKILESLSFKNKDKKDSFEIVVPTFRQDIKQEVDVIEEIARLYGYEKIPAKIPEARITPFSENKEKKIASLVRSILISFGLNEVVTSNFSSFSEERCIKILNPLTREQSALRTNLLSSLLLTFSYNLNQGNKKMAFFELGKVYSSRVPSIPSTGWEPSFQEKLMLSIGLYNSGNFFRLKGILEKLLKKMGILNYVIKDFTSLFLAEKVSAGIFINGKFAGYFGKASKKIPSFMKLTGEVYLAELDFELLAKSTSFIREFKPLPKYPNIRRDLAIVVAEEFGWKEIVKIIKDTSPLIKKVELFDLYKGKEIPSGYRGLAFSIFYQSAERTLTKKEVDKLDEKVEGELKKRYKIEIRGK
ncbi:MAG: phenylalanine--tRNA ligase subunit beta [Candidatus Omnitrophica bacterium]|nr:phenylalanine--tRNA ligase subunit beta [Candidatus Omnitrophota bacterium]